MYREIKSSHFNGDVLIEGYACHFGKTDRNGDMIMPGAFKKTLANKNIKDIKMLYQHKVDFPIGHWIQIYEDEKGLFVRGKINLDIITGRETYINLSKKIIDGLSIGYNVVTSAPVGKFVKRKIIECDLWEVSIVTFPMDQNAKILGIGEPFAASIDV